MNKASLPYTAKLFLKALQQAGRGELVLRGPGIEALTIGGIGNGPRAELSIRDWSMCRRVLFRGDIGFAESYRDGAWDSPDLPGLIEWATLNEKDMSELFTGNPPGRLLYALRNRFLKRNTPRLSQRNIRRHYDLGNHFFRQWLDPSMTYSSAYFNRDYSLSLEEAQLKKYERILDAGQWRQGDHILEIGCGWGGFAEVAALRGMRVSSITISREQYEYSVERIKAKSLERLADIQLKDYRHMEGTFDGIVSIEMIEAVGEKHWETYFRAIRDHLKPGGRCIIQGITIRDELFGEYRRQTDFIQQYIFPGGMLVSESLFRDMGERLQMKTELFPPFGPDYAETLRRWRESFLKSSGGSRKLGFDEAFRKIWDFYLASCEGLFRAGKVNVVHVSYQKRG